VADGTPGYRVTEPADALAPLPPDPLAWLNPDMAVLRLHRRVPPVLPLDAFGPFGSWIADAASAAAAPPDYVVAALLGATSALIGNARWAQAGPGWSEPPHLWCCAVGDSGSSKSPAGDALLRDVLPEVERRMQGDFPDRLRDHRAVAEAHVARMEAWKSEVKGAVKNGSPPPLPPTEAAPIEPQAPRLRISDVTIEKVASLLATAAPKGVLIVRDELLGWLLGMNTYNDGGRQFWLEAYGGRFYRVERQKNPEPIDVPRLAVAVYGTTQPAKLASVLRDADDGLLSRLLWFWPNPTQFRLGSATPATAWATGALDRLRLLDLATSPDASTPPRPVMVPLADDALPDLEAFGQDMQERQGMAGGLQRSALGKARGLALRLSLNLELLWWSARPGMEPPPTMISRRAFQAAAMLVEDYFMPMAERVFGDAATRKQDRDAATLARWVVRERAEDVHVRHLQREVRLPGLTDADAIKAAADALVDADWLAAPQVGFGTARKVAYRVNPLVLEAKHEPLG